MNTEEELNYQSAIEYLYSQLPMFSRVGAAAYKPGLQTSENLDAYFNHPHKKFKSIHIGGTNGKGSTSHLIASILQEQGYKVGLYTSPHLVDFRERMKINGVMIPKKDVIEFVEKWTESGYNGSPSFFELTMIMAFDWFAKKKIDYAVIEVGMGGRLDSTNIITPILSVITNISKDHTQFLGETLEKIASEKAGIIKTGVPIIIGEKQKDIDKVFLEKADELGSPILFASDSPLIESIEETDIEGWACKFDGKHFLLPLAGDYQKKNIETVLHAVVELRNLGIEINEKAVISGIENVVKNTGLMGRWSVISQKPLTIADTGHNIGGLQYNVSQLKRLLEKRPNGKMRIILGFVADKDIDNILVLMPQKAEYYVTNAKIPRALPAKQLYEKMLTLGLHGGYFDSVSSAFETAYKEASDDDIIFIGGSTFIVADFLSSLQKKRNL